MHRRRVAVLFSLFVLLAGCSRRPEEKAARFIAAGQRFYQQGDYARAVLQFRNAIQALPGKAEPHYQLALALFAQSNVASAAGELKKATELNPGFADAQLMLANILMASRNAGMVMEAERRIQQLIASAPQDKEAWNALALADWQLGKQNEAEERFEEALRKFPENLKASVSLAQIKMARRDFDGAEKALKNAAEQAPNKAFPLVALGEFYGLRDNLPDAEQCFRQAIAIEPKNSLPALELMAIQMRRGQIVEARATYERITSVHGNQYRAVYAALLFDAGQQNEAIAEFEKLIAQNPPNRDTRTWLVRAYLRTNRPNDARGILDDALRRNPQDVDALLQRSILQLLTGNYAAAESDAAQVLHFRPDSTESHYVLAKAYAARGVLRSERQEFSEALRINPSFLPARIDLAQTFIASGDARLAMKIINETPAADRDKAPVMIARNWALAAAGEVEELRASVKKLLELHPAPDGLLQQALLQLNDDEFTGARISITKVLDQNPSDIRALDLLARSYALENRGPEAVKTLRVYAAAHPTWAAVQQLWGRWALDRDDRDEAKKAFQAALTATPRFVPAALALAEIDIAEKRFENARSRLTDVLAQEKQNVPARLMIADLDESAGNHAAALAAYKAVLETEPDNLPALNNAAYLLAEFVHQLDEALKYAERAQQLSPDNPAILDTLGWVLYSKGLYAIALPHLQRATSKAGTHQRLYHLGMAYIKMGDRQNGRRALQQALEKGSQLPEIRSVLADSEQ